MDVDLANDSEADDSERRKKRIFYFYNRSVQLRYAVKALFIIFTTILAYTFLLYREVSGVLMKYPLQATADAESLAAMAMQKFISTIVWGSLTCVVIAGGTAAIWAMLITHRYEGPLIRINRHLRDLAEGKINPPMLVRRRDEVAALVETVNLLTSKMETKNQSDSK